MPPKSFEPFPGHRVQWTIRNADGTTRQVSEPRTAVGFVVTGWRPESGPVPPMAALARVAARKGIAPELVHLAGSYLALRSPSFQLEFPRSPVGKGTYVQLSDTAYVTTDLACALVRTTPTTWVLGDRATDRTLAVCQAGMTHLQAFALDFLLGGLSAAFSKTAAYPFERAKLLRQHEHHLIATGRLDRPSTGVIDCLSQVIRREGFLALWRGNLMSCLRYFPTQALNFVAKETFRNLLGAHTSPGLRLLNKVLSGGMAGAFSLGVSYPLDYLITRMACDAPDLATGRYEFSGLLDCANQTFRRAGPAGFYRGYGVSVLGIVLYRATYFGLYDNLKSFAGTSILSRFLFGWSVTILAGLATYPLDTLRRRLILTATEPDQPRTSFGLVAKVAREEGLASLMRGAAANTFRALVGALALVLYDLFKPQF